jgi:hypothetical protein
MYGAHRRRNQQDATVILLDDSRRTRRGRFFEWIEAITRCAMALGDNRQHLPQQWVCGITVTHPCNERKRDTQRKLRLEIDIVDDESQAL